MTLATKSCKIQGGKVYITTNQAVLSVGTPAKPKFVTDYRDLGEVKMAEITIDVEEKSRKTHRSPEGGNACAIYLVKGGTLKMDIDCSDAMNTAMISMSDTKDITASAVVAEPISIIKDPANPIPLDLEFLPDVTATITLKAAGGATPFVLGTDYYVEDGAIFVPPTSSIPDAVAPAYAHTLEVTYTKRLQVSLQGLMKASESYRIHFAGFEQGDGEVDPTKFTVFNAQLKPSGFKVISDDLATISAEFTLSPLPAMGRFAGYSKYFAGLFGAQAV
jgi:hypothetical protein